MAIGLLIYFVYGMRNSRLRRGEVTNPEAELPEDDLRRVQTAGRGHDSCAG
jgi:hypothetical protein